MNAEWECESLLSEMYTVYIESCLASPLSGCITLEVSPNETIKEVVSNFLDTIQKEQGESGLAVFDKSHNKLLWNATVESQGIEAGSKLYIRYDRSFHFRPVYILVIAICIIIIACVLFISTAVLFGATGHMVPFDYGIVIDAGSSHSEVFLYQWAGNKDEGTGDVHERDYCTYYEGIAEGVSPDGIVSCVNTVLKSYPQDSTSLPLLYLGATGGMRLLNITNPKDASLILMTLKYALQTSKVQVNSVDIIQGDDEGLFSWITTNFLSQTLNQSKGEQTFGALDLGGASTQYAFSAEMETVTNASNVKNLTLYGHKYSVISESFLCFGLTQALHRNHALIFMAEKNITASDPCSPKNYMETVGAKFYLENPCVQNKKFSRWLQFNLDQNLTVLGESNYEKCKHNVKRLINEQSCKDDGFSSCLERINLAELNMKFMAFSSFYYVVSYLNGSSSLEKFINATKDWCNLSLDQVIARAHDKKELSHLLTYCFGAIYIAELCTSNYGFNYSTWSNLLFKQRIKNADVGWSLGYMINATNAIPEELPSPPVIPLTIFIICVVISLLMFFISFVLLRKISKHSHRNHHERLLENY